MARTRIAHPDDVKPDEMRSFDAGPLRVAVANVGGAFHAFDDACTHRACSLTDGELEPGRVVCPCHRGAFDLETGAVLEGPPPAPISVYRIEADAEGLWIELPEDLATT